jgi:hypothetical protein
MGERHDVRLRIPGPDALMIADRLTQGLQEAEFAIAGHIVADIVCKGKPRSLGDGSIEIAIEALTVEE